jgi:hypothetical protein
MTRRETVHNEYTQEEKRRVQRDTLHGRAVAEMGAVGGRWAAESKAKVVGSTSFKYPALPPNSPWASEPVGLEPPLGYSVEAMPAVGEAFELAAEAGAQGVKPALQQHQPDQPRGDEQREGVTPHPPARRRRSPQSKRKG